MEYFHTANFSYWLFKETYLQLKYIDKAWVFTRECYFFRTSVIKMWSVFKNRKEKEKVHSKILFHLENDMEFDATLLIAIWTAQGIWEEISAETVKNFSKF